MKKLFLPLFFLTLFSFSAIGQTAKQYIKAADKEFADKNFYSAMKFY